MDAEVLKGNHDVSPNCLHAARVFRRLQSGEVLHVEILQLDLSHTQTNAMLTWRQWPGWLKNTVDVSNQTVHSHFPETGTRLHKQRGNMLCFYSIGVFL